MKKYIGIYKKGKDYRSRISFKGRYIILGDFSLPEEAAFAYNVAAINFRGELARLNAVKVQNGRSISDFVLRVIDEYLGKAGINVQQYIIRDLKC